MPRQYVCGFIFNENATKVALIRKKRPDWQAGLLNGIGGFWEIGETRHDAMRREFLEEAGSNHYKWLQFATISGKQNDVVIHFFSAVGNLDELKAQTDESIEIHNVLNLPANELVRAVNWLIPVALTGGYKPLDIVDLTFN